MGKPRGADVYEGKMTLPLIHALTLLHGEKRERLATILESFHDDYFDELIELLNASDSLNYTEILIQNHINRALEAIDGFEQTSARKTLEWITEVVKNRVV